MEARYCSSARRGHQGLLVEGLPVERLSTTDLIASPLHRTPHCFASLLRCSALFGVPPFA